MKPLRTGVVGVGRFGQHHARICAELQQFDLVGIHDIDRERGEEIAARNDTRFFPALESLLKKCDVALIVTSTAAHAEIAEETISRGLPTFIEKPLAPAYQTASKLVQDAKAQGIPLATGLLERFNPALRAALDRLEQPKWAQLLRLGLWAGRRVTADAIADLMIHDLDILHQVSPGPLKVKSASGCSLSSDFIDRCLVEMYSDDSFIAHIEADRVSNHRMRVCRIQDGNRIFVIDLMDQHLHISPPLPARGNELMKWEQVEIVNAQPLQLELLSFCDLVHGREAEICHGDCILASLELMEDVRAAIQ